MGGIEGRRSDGRYDEFRIEDDRAMTVALGGLNRRIILHYFNRKLGDITLASPTVVDSRTVTLSPGHGVVAGNLLTFYEGTRQFQAFALSVAVNVITLDTPLDQAFSTSAIGERGTHLLNVDGSVTPLTFTARPGPGASWAIKGISVYLIDNTQMDDSTFAGIPALANGIVLRRKNGISKTIGNVKTNAGLRVFGSPSFYSDKAPAGLYGFFSRLNTEEFFGASVELNGATADELQIIVQDNLTAIDNFRALAHGHVNVP